MNLVETIVIARVCHEANRAFCQSIGDNSQKAWDDAEEWQRESAVNGVQFAFANPGLSAEDQHEAWVADKLRAGWQYGPVKNAEKKEHPCLVLYQRLPPEQQMKDHLFRAIVKALSVQ